MVLSPQDIHNKEFSVKMRGYNIDEVNEFLDRIIKDYQLTLSENIDMKNRLKQTEDELKYYNGMKDSLNQSIIIAQNAADKVKVEAQNEANNVTEQSRKQADEILNDASVKAKDIVENISNQSKALLIANDDLRKTTESFRKKIRTLLESQMQFVNSPEWDQMISGIDGNFNKVNEQINNLDNFKETVVQSEGKEMPADATIKIYPDGSFKEIE
ncbi:Cell division protein DivIVA [Apilactobacillus kunkeei]|uniref:DivIVA domain-containing protein n=1 Tax=Apilactobacillus waqarii TaxID=2851006 RepID=UPI0021FADCE0|nr:Cell division protein DivIVA [Apilactobacillus kunkeei]CAI2617168.1 Cell division protein DivIVA [Apilactobacillus kunkeei]CAI2617899.1 Cell division protein DivIVA [Apilactobacillus kunkeei]CAI2619641.1 Cell division protein DivIVA [Apilactobacillus kunkeei]CAI2619834.1 Cell division protein DivIVA [Apilactobacillus kunkeei]